MQKVLIMLAAGLIACGMVVFFAFLFAIITKIAWHFSVAKIFFVHDITFWQAFWLNVLGGMLCKNSK